MKTFRSCVMLSALTSLLLAVQVFGVSTTQAGAAEPSCVQATSIKSNRTSDSASVTSSTITQPAATCCQPRAASCVRAPQFLVPSAVAFPELQPAILRSSKLIADGAWNLINAQINAMQLDGVRTPKARASIDRSLV